MWILSLDLSMIFTFAILKIDSLFIPVRKRMLLLFCYHSDKEKMLPSNAIWCKIWYLPCKKDIFLLCNMCWYHDCVLLLGFQIIRKRQNRSDRSSAGVVRAIYGHIPLLGVRYAIQRLMNGTHFQHYSSVFQD